MSKPWPTCCTSCRSTGKFHKKIRGVSLLHLLTHRMIEIPAGVATLGLPRGGETFGWDNEYEAHTVQVPSV